MTQGFDSLQDWGLSLLILLVPRAHQPHPPTLILTRPSHECVRKVDCVDLTKDCEFLFKGFAQKQCFYIFSMVNAGFGFLVNITNFEFLCRKVNFAHVGIVQNLIFFIKSARRFRKTISTLASQHVVWIPGIPRPTTVHFWIWEPWSIWREMHGWQTWSIR